jgi:hypothetical protein
MPAIEALHARDVMEDQHPVAGLEIPNFLADSRNFASRFVSIYPRRRQQVVFDLFQIGMTDPATVDFYEYFTRSDLRHRNRLDADSALAGINGRPHVWRQAGQRDCGLYFRIDSWQ